MNEKFPFAKIFEALVPFVIAGMAIALFLGLLFMFSYVLIWGIIIGGTLWVIATIRQILFSNTKTTTDVVKKSEGRIIEHNDKK
ncbi:hypothetical protein Lsan_0547 [Legionella santicrucis]|uniref:Transmembrane protein n=1 Tax=Legionella santicrucis TaxID=45074 RepID=A0A0W0ZCC1_9GAMM|nr:hypothetical protein [Legionella santicrucis]KTD66602.1 hypothetical protein Lsan_0547 [Legionella santicrucis]